MKGLYVASILCGLFSLAILLTNIANQEKVNEILCFFIWALTMLFWLIGYIKEVNFK